MQFIAHTLWKRRHLFAFLLLLCTVVIALPLVFLAHAHPVDHAAAPAAYRVLFDNAHAETAGNADWVISSSQPDPLGENPQPQKESDWTGGLSSWGVALEQTGRYSLMTSTSPLTYGSSSNALDLSSFNALILPEPNSLFSSAEKTAIMTFVRNGGGVFMIADHSGSDRNHDGYDSLHIFNDLMNNSGAGNDPFGIQFDDRTIAKDYPNVDTSAPDPILQGPFGTSTTSLINQGTTETINAADNPGVVGVIYTSGSSATGTTNVFIARSTYGKGRVIAAGDSSATDDGTCASGHRCYDGWHDAGAQDNILYPNGTEWLASSGSALSTPTASPMPGGTATPGAGVSPTPTISPTSVVSPTATTTVPTSLPRFDHVVVVVEENKDYAQLIGPNSPAPYINMLAGQGMLFTNSHAITHPSQPNYLDLFSGSDQGIKDDSCDPARVLPQPDLGGQLLGAGFSFAGYSENMPSAGYTGCFDASAFNSLYARKHNPWANFSDVSGAKTNLTFDSFPTTTDGFAALPTVSFVVPNLINDMHSGDSATDIQQGDSWLQQHLDGYAQWGKTHNSLLIVTCDEEDQANGVEANPNQVATIFVGQHVVVGTNASQISHFDLLRTLEDMYGLPPANQAASATAITGVWD